MIGAAVLISAYVKKLIEALDKLGSMAVEPLYFKKMLQGNPKLMDEDPDEVAKLWSTLYNTSPSLSKDPVAAGAFIKQNIDMQVVPQFGGPSIDTYKTLTGIENGLQEGRGSELHSDTAAMAAGLF